MIAQPPRPSTRTDSLPAHFSIEELYEQMNKSLQRWGRSSDSCYHVFQPIVEMNLAIVEQWAKKLVRLEEEKIGSQRDVIELDHQEAVWSLSRKVIQGLEPSLIDFERPVVQALQQLSQTGQWPKNVAIPPECRSYVALSLIYIWKSKSSKEVARLFGMPKRSFYQFRANAIHKVVKRLQAWEQHCTTMQ